jgi:fanconi anemia group J protein
LAVSLLETRELLQVSEGINFADEHARAVVLLGVPYPNLKDCKVKLKRDFNNHPTNRQRGLISGDDWYTLQAYRAMNQVGSQYHKHSISSRYHAFKCFIFEMLHF